MRKMVLGTGGVLGLVTLAWLGLLAAIPRDHQVDIRATFRATPPATVWRFITDHAAEPGWLRAFSVVTRLPDDHGRPVWRRSTRDSSFVMTMLTIHEQPDRRYEFLLLRDDQPRHQPWDARWVIDVTPAGRGTVLRIREYGWTGGVVFFFLQRVLASPHDFPEYYLRQLGVALQDDPEVFVARSH